LVVCFASVTPLWASLTRTRTPCFRTSRGYFTTGQCYHKVRPLFTYLPDVTRHLWLISVLLLLFYSSNPVLKAMWPEGKLSITEVTKRPLTAATLFKNSMISLVENLASKVSVFEAFLCRPRSMHTL